MAFPDFWALKQKHPDLMLGWLDVLLDSHSGKSQGLNAAIYNSIVLLGMGGSSLAPETFSKVFGPFPRHPDFHVLDTTDPDAIYILGSKLELSKTLFIVSSKSGGTLETNCLCDYFLEKVGNPKQFIAITDPGSSLEKKAQHKGFLDIYHGAPSIGGRYSALSPFGLVPAQLIGVDIERLLKSARAMRKACQSDDPTQNPGAKLGLELAKQVQAGRDKLTFVMEPQLESLADWLEQLIAESSGKDGQGAIPIVGETLGAPEVYAADRVFVSIQLTGSSLFKTELKKLQEAGHPVISIELADPYQIGAEMFRWEFATAVLCHALGVDAFNQPDVESSKQATIALLDHHCEEPKATWQSRSDAPAFKDIKPGDYFAIQAFINPSEENKTKLQELRMHIRDTQKVATTLGFGPRFLHSTGQLHKGGPNTGVFLQIVSEAQVDLGIPGKSYSFDRLKHAQAQADFETLAKLGRRVSSNILSDFMYSNLQHNFT